MSYAVLEWILIGLLVLTGLVAGTIILREVWRRLLRQKLQQDSQTVRTLLTNQQKEQFNEINKLMFHLRDNFDHQVVEHVLREYIQEAETPHRKHLREIYRFFEFTDKYVRDLSGLRWRERAEAAYILGLIGDPKAVPHLIARMQDQDEDEQHVKMACAQALGMIKDPQAIPSLIQALEDVNQWSSVKVAEMLVHFGEKAVPDLLKALHNDTNTNQRIWAAQILGAISSTAAIPMLIQRLRDRDANVRIATVEALGRLKSPLAVHSIIDMLLRDPVAEVRSQAAIALGQIADEAALSPLINALNDPEYWTRVRAVEALERLGADHTPHLTRLLMFDPRQEVRRRAAQALERLGVLEQKVQDLVSDSAAKAAEAKQLLLAVARQGQIQRIQGYLSDPNFKVRSKITEILGECGGPGVEPPLLQAARDTSWVVRIKALGFLAQNPSDQTAKVLQEALFEADDLQRPFIVESLKKLNPSQLEHFFPQLLMLIHDDNIEIRHHAVELLANFRLPETQSALAGCLQDPVASIRLAAVESLGSLDSREATPVLVGALADPDAEVRQRSAYFLGQWKDERSINGLLKALEDADDQGRRGIAEALSQFGLDQIYQRLDELMGTDSPAIKVGVCWVLGATQDSRAIRLLSFFLHDSLPQVRSAAIGSLARIPDPQVLDAIAAHAQDVNKKVRASVANAFCRIGYAGSHLQALLNFLDDPDDFVRRRASLAVGMTAPPEQIEEQLIRRYEQTRHPQEKMYMLLGIGLISSTRSFQFILPFYHRMETRHSLLELLEQEDAAVQQRFFSNLNLEHLDQAVSPEGILNHYVLELQQSQSAEKRAAAINALEVLAIPEVLPYLLDALASDPDEQIRQQAARALHYLALQQSGLQSSIQKGLLKATQDPVPDVCLAALEALEGVADQEANARLFELIDARSRSIQKSALHLLGTINRTDIHHLVALIQQSEDEDRRRRAIFALRDVEDASVIDFFQEMLRHPQRSLRAAVVRALEGHIQRPETQDMLLHALKDPASEVRYWAIHSLATYEDIQLLPQFLVMQKDPDPRVRIELLQALARIPLLPTLEPITQLLHDPIEQVRQQAYLCLLQMSRMDALQAFLHAYPKTPLAFREQFLPEVTTHRITESLQRALQTAPDPDHRLSALLVIGMLDPDYQHHALYVHALRDPSADVRREATRILLASSQEIPSSILQQIAQDPDPSIQKMLQTPPSHLLPDQA